MVHYKDTVISGKVQNYFQEHIKEALKDLNNYIVDIFVAPDKVKAQQCWDQVKVMVLYTVGSF